MQLSKRFNEITIVGIFLALFVLIFSLLSYLYQDNQWWPNLVAEILGIVVTVFLVDKLFQRRRMKRIEKVNRTKTLRVGFLLGMLISDLIHLEDDNIIVNHQIKNTFDSDNNYRKELAKKIAIKFNNSAGNLESYSRFISGLSIYTETITDIVKGVYPTLDSDVEDKLLAVKISISLGKHTLKNKSLVEQLFTNIIYLKNKCVNFELAYDIEGIG